MLLNQTTVIVRVYRRISCPGTIDGSVPILTNRATGWPLYVTSNNKLGWHSRKISLVDSCQSLQANVISFSFNLDFRVKAKVPFPQYLLHHGLGNPRYESTCYWSTRESENPTQSLRFIISENILVSSAAAQWMNKDRKHVGRKLLYFDRCALICFTTSLMTNI